jgi:hypothetical protein
MSSSNQNFATTTTDLSTSSLPTHSDVLNFTTIPTATWLTQLMVAQKVAEAVWRQGTLTTEFVDTGSMPTADGDAPTAAADTARAFQDLRERRDRRARVTRLVAARRWQH